LERAFEALLLCLFVSVLGLGIVSPIMPVYASQLGASGIWLGIIYSAFSMASLIFMPIMGRISDVRSKKKIICVGLAAYMIVSVLYVFAWDVFSLIFMRFIHGFGSSMVMPIAMAYAADLAPEGKEGTYMGTMNVSLFLGMGTGPIIGGYLTDYFTISAPFYAMTALVTCSLILTLILVPEQQKTLRQNRTALSFQKMFTNRNLLGVFILRAANALGRGTIMSFFSLFAVQSLGISLSMTGTILAVGQLSNGLLQRPFGILADSYSKIKLIIAGSLLTAVGYFFIPVTDSWLSLLATQLIIALGSGFMIPAISAITTIEGRGLGMGSTMGVFNTAMSIGMISSSLISGALSDIIGLSNVFYLGGITAIAGLGLFSLYYTNVSR
jgi:DHA1 family multidrug resistance protein-like MFS transporter